MGNVARWPFLLSTITQIVSLRWPWNTDILPNTVAWKMLTSPNNTVTPVRHSRLSLLKQTADHSLSHCRHCPCHWRTCLFVSLKSKDHSWKLEGACKLLLAVTFFPPVGQDPALSLPKGLPNYTVCMMLRASRPTPYHSAEVIFCMAGFS